MKVAIVMMATIVTSAVLFGFVLGQVFSTSSAQVLVTLPTIVIR